MAAPEKYICRIWDRIVVCEVQFDAPGDIYGVTLHPLPFTSNSYSFMLSYRSWEDMKSKGKAVSLNDLPGLRD